MCKENNKGKSYEAAGNGKRPGKDALFANLTSSKEFTDDLQHVADLLDKEKGSGLEIGRIARHWIGDRRYHRILNASVFADQIKTTTGKDLSARLVRNYMNAHRVQEMLQTAGAACPNLSVSHLAQVADAHCESDEERIELAQRADAKKATVRQIRPMAQRLHAERLQARRLVDVVATEAKVKVVDAISLLREQEDGSIECAILDWQWSGSTWGRNFDYPEVYTPPDPAGNLCECLAVLKEKLSRDGSIFVFYTSVGFLDPRIAQTCERVGLKHAGKIIWQKTSGAFQDADTMLRVAHEEVHILCHADHSPKPVNGGANSVTPKWASPTNAVSGRQLEAVHIHQKPIAIMDLLIRISTVNGLVVDPFAGSGAAGIAALRRGCSYVGSELVPEIAEIANRRIALTHGENEEVVDAINFFLASASSEQKQAITGRLSKCGLHCVQNVANRIAA